MNEEKDIINNNEDENISVTASRSLFSDSEETATEDIPVVENKTDGKAIEKKQKRQAKKRDAKKRYPDKAAFLLGVVVLIFAVIGIVLTVYNSVRYITGTNDTGSEFAQYNKYLTPVAAVDPDSFEDITDADDSQLLNVAIWSILSLETTPDTYSYQGGYMLIPETDIEKAYMAIFGPETIETLTHTSVEGYNCTFEYDSEAGVYKIPVTTISPIYTPQVTEVKKSGSSLIVTVNYLSAESWNKDDEGNFVAPEPDKVMKITLRELQGSYYISAIQTSSATVPETVTINTATGNAEDTSQTAETTTVSPAAEKTTLGGNVS